MPVTINMILVFSISLIVNVLFCLSLRKALFLVRPENRLLRFTSIWLMLVPMLNLFFNFWVVSKMAASLNRELQDRDFEVEAPGPGYRIGMCYAFLEVLRFLLAISLNVDKFSATFKPLESTWLGAMQAIFSIASVILFIQYWLKINWHTKVLQKDLLDEGTTPAE